MECRARTASIRRRASGQKLAGAGHHLHRQASDSGLHGVATGLLRGRRTGLPGEASTTSRPTLYQNRGSVHKRLNPGGQLYTGCYRRMSDSAIRLTRVGAYYPMRATLTWRLVTGSGMDVILQRIPMARRRPFGEKPMPSSCIGKNK